MAVYYELFSLDGEASVTPGMNEDENTLFQRYDEITDSYYSDRTRIETVSYTHLDVYKRQGFNG